MAVQVDLGDIQLAERVELIATVMENQKNACAAFVHELDEIARSSRFPLEQSSSSPRDYTFSPPCAFVGLSTSESSG